MMPRSPRRSRGNLVRTQRGRRFRQTQRDRSRARRIAKSPPLRKALTKGRTVIGGWQGELFNSRLHELLGLRPKRKYKLIFDEKTYSRLDPKKFFPFFLRLVGEFDLPEIRGTILKLAKLYSMVNNYKEKHSDVLRGHVPSITPENEQTLYEIMYDKLIETIIDSERTGRRLSDDIEKILGRLKVVKISTNISQDSKELLFDLWRKNLPLNKDFMRIITASVRSDRGTGTNSVANYFQIAFLSSLGDYLEKRFIAEFRKKTGK